jgi:hypothetical protein
VVTNEVWAHTREHPRAAARRRDPDAVVNGYTAWHPTFVGLFGDGRREKVPLQGGSWPLLPVVLRHHQSFSGRLAPA